MTSTPAPDTRLVNLEALRHYYQELTQAADAATRKVDARLLNQQQVPPEDWEAYLTADAKRAALLDLLDRLDLRFAVTLSLARAGGEPMTHTLTPPDCLIIADDRDPDYYQVTIRLNGTPEGTYRCQDLDDLATLHQLTRLPLVVTTGDTTAAALIATFGCSVITYQEGAHS
jgi:hypothetical protein